MRLHLEALPGDTNTVAVLYGPVVLAGELGKEGLRSELIHTRVQLMCHKSS